MDNDLLKWDNFYRNKDTPWRKISIDLNSILQKQKINSGHALDLGCGNGEYSKFFFDKRFSVEALDFSKEALRVAKKENPGPDYIFWDIENIVSYPFKHQQYDVILDVKVFNFIKNKKRYLEVIQQHLNGIFVLILFLKNLKKPVIAMEEQYVNNLLSEFFTFELKKEERKENLIGIFICWPK